MNMYFDKANRANIYFEASRYIVVKDFLGGRAKLILTELILKFGSIDKIDFEKVNSKFILDLKVKRLDSSVVEFEEEELDCIINNYFKDETFRHSCKK